MTPHDPDERLAMLMHDAVADVEPADRLGELRASTSSSPRRWWLATGGTVLAAAAAVTAVAVLGGGQPTAVDPGPATTPSTPAPVTTAVPAYFVGETPAGERLYREFQLVPDAVPGLAGLGLLESGPSDPDYRSMWPEGSFADRISDPEGVVHVYLTDAAPAEPSELALQQVVYTLGAGFQEPLEVTFHRGGTILATVARAPQLDVLSHVNLSDPTEGQAVGGTLAVTGVANSFEANVLWSVEGTDLSGSFMASGYMDVRLFPFSGDIDVSSLDPGTYTLIVETDDPSGGAEGTGPYSDTRTFVLE